MHCTYPWLPLSLTSLQVATKTQQLKRIKSDIQSVVRLAQDGNRRVQEEAAKQMATDQGSFDATKQRLTQDIAALRKTYQDLVDANRDKEQTLRKVRNIIKGGRGLCGCICVPLHPSSNVTSLRCTHPMSCADAPCPPSYATMHIFHH